MFNLFYQGGPLFMGILTILLFIVIVLSVYFLYLIIRKEYKSLDLTLKKLKFIKTTGIYALVTGILGQLIGLYSAFTQIEAAREISPVILAGGLKISMITTIYGMIIFLISYLFWAALYYSATKNRL